MSLSPAIPASLEGAEAMPEGAIRQRLLAPAGKVTLEQLVGIWFETDIRWVLEGWGKAIGDPGFPGRIRGAFGAELMASASQQARDGQPCPWSPPCAFEILFRKQGRMEAGLDFPAPGSWRWMRTGAI